MYLLIIWILFTLLCGYMTEMDQAHYLLFSSTMFYFTYIYNNVNPIIITPKICALFLMIPSIIIWFIADRFNSFLALDPISNELFMVISLLYFYSLIYIASECN